MKLRDFFGSTLREWATLDYRSLALLRISMGFTILLDLIQRATSLYSHYTDGGVLPRSDLLNLWGTKWMVSLHLASGDLWFQIILFCIAGIIALFLIFGYHTRFSIIASWFLLISLQTRNPLVLQGGDVVFRVTLFFMMFLPLANVWSLDRLFNRIPRSKEKGVADFATLGYITQVSVLYIFTGLLKTGSAWHVDGSAVYYALNVDQLVTPMGVWLRNIPSILPFFTHAVWFYETFGIILFLIPWKNWIFRTVGIIGFIALQIGFNSSMRLGLFGMITISALFGLLPSEFWEVIVAPIVRKIRVRGKPGLTIVYDANCSFCHKLSVLIARMLLLHSDTRIIPASEHMEAQKIMDAENSWVIIDDKKSIYTGFRGFASVCEHSPYAKFIAPLFKIWPVAPLGEVIYRMVADRRVLACVPEPVKRPPSVLVTYFFSLVVLFFTLYILALNFETLPNARTIIPEKLRPIASLTRLDQQFNMFAPTPLVEDGWYVMPGKLRNGTEIDVFSGHTTVSYEKPTWVAYTYKDQRWQKYLMNLWSSDLSEFRQGYGRYLCRTWNSKHSNDEELVSFDIIFMLERTPPPGQPQAPVVPTPIWHHECF
jgi:predicted DCC family thiol-disulfide oxidoreductase YuxK